MLVIQICVGSSCFLRGSREVIETVEKLINHYRLDDVVVLKGSFCMEHCNDGVTLKIGDKTFTGVNRESITGLFEKEVFEQLYGVKNDEPDQHK
ncbi:MAG: (2Fe-2S) ferredoxin domain-containing protein [Pelotomaculum sp.]|uniref:NADH:ubiquinone oxidoreductase 24 kD subunit n=1 Tax=Pelotomaculum thermopropionicum (strain DSM 13744 / JCM 10971 / SI) TaxID=370438 RepID=A5D6B9_PELTS|nr:(2Fe-2S) ferredoxin domain-containing protein [Pelotomaculum sp.]BAF58208.1 hypothetical protein PTH_0027 [Pelotomaculum thermopropionicum SI]